MTMLLLWFEICEFQVQNNTVVALDPPCMPDLAPCDFFLLLKIMLKLKGHHIDTVKGTQREKQLVLDTLTEEDFQGLL